MPTEAAAPSSYAAELAAQAGWRLRPAYAGVDWFTRLVEAEFAAPAEQAARAMQALQRMLSWAAAAVPWYRTRLPRLRRDFTRDDLQRLPILSRLELRDHGAALRAASLPRGERLAGSTRTSGSTGQPVEVWHTANSLELQALLGQRQLRWFRFDPRAAYAAIKLPGALPRDADGRPIAAGATLRLPAWPTLGDYFETGEYLGYASTTPIDDQLAWLHAIAPRYLVARAAVLEHLALAAEELGPPSLDGIFAIADQVTPDLRRRLARSFGAPPHQNYGLNEMGLVAVRCAAGGRYHVHVEHCWHEIVDADGRACRPGEQGRLLLSCLSNPALPLLRYDTGDRAQVAEGPCPCGRSLPAFAELVGRELHLAPLPPGTYRRKEALATILEALPAAAWRGLRQYQIRHHRDESFTLLLAGHSPPAAEFERTVLARWQTACAAHALRIEFCAEIPPGAGGKFQVFVSEFVDGAR
ncbi:MAG: phenylacetate--CoA ligase family protein [Gammaproteobacteria bacterium]